MLTDPVWFIHQILGLEVGIYLIGRHDFQLQMLEIFHLAFPLVIHGELNQTIPLTTPSSSRGDEWSIKIFNCSQNLPLLDCSQNLNECSLARVPKFLESLASSQSQFFISGRARKKIALLGMLANARKDHSSPLLVI